MKTILPGFAIVLAFTTGACLLYGQTNVSVDTSGDGLLSGKYFVRQVVFQNVNASGVAGEATLIYGTATFDGKGNYTLTGTVVDNTVSSGAPKPLSFTGTYAIAANGTGHVDNPIPGSSPAAWVYGAVGQGVFSGSSTESLYNDLFVAIPAGTTAATNASFNGNYWLAVIDYGTGNALTAKNALTKLTPNGSGTLGTLNINGFTVNQTQTTSIGQSASGATYSFASDGTATLTIPNPSGVTSANALFSGTKQMYISADGNFVLGGSTNGYDMFFGVRALSGSTTDSTFSGLYYMSGLEAYPDGSGGAVMDTFYGAINSNGAGTQIMHERIAADEDFNGPLPPAYDFLSDNETVLNSDGTITDAYLYQYAFGAGGNAFVAIGSATGPYASLTIGVHALSPTASGTVWLNPIGVTNAASFSPITMSIAPGELITLYGTGLAQATLSIPEGQAYPTNLGGVQVLINGRAAPVYAVSSTQVSAVVPYATASDIAGSLATVQVKNNGTLSNTVTMFLDSTSPGIFTLTQNGVGNAAALHQDYSIVTPQNPAKPGEYVSIYLTGLGTVTPTVAEGAPGPSSTLSWADVFNNGQLEVWLDDPQQGPLPCTIQYAGLAPGLNGKYQINILIPSGVSNTATTGGTYVELDILDPNTGISLLQQSIQVVLPIQ